MRPSRRAVHSGSDGSSSCIHALAVTSVMPVAAPSTSRPTSRSSDSVGPGQHDRRRHAREQQAADHQALAAEHVRGRAGVGQCRCQADRVDREQRRDRPPRQVEARLVDQEERRGDVGAEGNGEEGEPERPTWRSHRRTVGDATRAVPCAEKWPSPCAVASCSIGRRRGIVPPEIVKPSMARSC